jgi:hypothetical protein
MRRACPWFCVVVVFGLCCVFVPQPEIAASNSAAPHAATAANLEASGEKSASTFLLRDPDIPASNAVAMIDPDKVSCPNCLIRLCLIGSNSKLTGYCLEGARGGICHEDYNPTHCPPGETPRKPIVSQQCGSSGRFRVDALRPCS